MKIKLRHWSSFDHFTCSTKRNSYLLPSYKLSLFICEINIYVMHGASDSVTTNFSALSNLADAQNVSCLGLCGRDICLKAMLNMGWVLSTDSC